MNPVATDGKMVILTHAAVQQDPRAVIDTLATISGCGPWVSAQEPVVARVTAAHRCHSVANGEPVPGCRVYIAQDAAGGQSPSWRDILAPFKPGNRREQFTDEYPGHPRRRRPASGVSFHV